MKKVIAVVGPTGSGKTKLSLAIAKAIGGEIINGDSVQVYQGLDIGSAKIKVEEMDGIKHHLIDHVTTINSYSVYDFQLDCRAKIESIDHPIIVGGTGLYIKAALDDYEFVEKGRSTAFEEKYQAFTNDELYEALLIKDPNLKVDRQNRRRLLRALEQAELGMLRSKKNRKDVKRYDSCILYLDLDRSTLKQRLIDRLDRQIQDGFIDEVKRLSDKGIVVNAIGYRELKNYLDGIYSLEEAKDEIIRASMRLAKKQKTWFKNQMEIVMLDALSENVEDQAITIAKAFMGGSSCASI